MSTATRVQTPFGTIKSSFSEAAFLRTLGLLPWATETGVEVHVGDVRPFADWDTIAKDTTISIYAYPTPALSYRFEILRASEDVEGMERVTMKTGSGFVLGDLWETVLAVASNSLSVSAPRPA